MGCRHHALKYVKDVSLHRTTHPKIVKIQASMETSKLFSYYSGVDAKMKLAVMRVIHIDGSTVSSNLVDSTL